MTKQNKAIEEFKKYRKEYRVKSDPEDYVHVGLDYSHQFSDFIRHMDKALTETREEWWQDGFQGANDNMRKNIIPKIKRETRKEVLEEIRDEIWAAVNKLTEKDEGEGSTNPVR